MSYMHLYLTYFQHSLVGIVGFTGCIPQMMVTGQFPVSGFASQAAVSSPTCVSADMLVSVSSVAFNSRVLHYRLSVHGQLH